MPPTTEGHVEVVAHRGASHERPEHTEEAYVLAIEQGADALECDVRLTADGHLVCHHDPVLDRTSSGRGRLSGRTLAQLRELDWDSPAGGPLTLERLFELAADAGRPVGLAVETKHPVRYAGEVERQVVDLADRFGWVRPGSPVRVMSFSVAAVARVRRFAPDLTTVLLVDAVPRWARFAPAGYLPAGVPVLGAGQHLLASAPRWVAAGARGRARAARVDRRHARGGRRVPGRRGGRGDHQPAAGRAGPYRSRPARRVEHGLGSGARAAPGV